MNKYFRFIPALQWLSQYKREYLMHDLIAAVIVTVLLIPQSLAYAMLAGVPPEVGLYASILPLAAYAVFGTSRTLSVGPVAVVSLMTATSVGAIADQGSAGYLAAATTLALLSGLILFAMGLLRLGFVTNFLSHPVISGFITASGVIIGFSQLKHIFGVKAEGDTLLELVPSLLTHVENIHLPTLAVGVFVLGFLYLARQRAARWLMGLGVGKHTAGLVAKTAPIFGVLMTVLAAYGLNLESRGVVLTGAIPAGLPTLDFSLPTWSLMKELAVPALLISIIGYVESISVGKTLAAKRRQKVDADKELLGLGAANLASSVSGGFPVTGGFSRSVVNFDAGAVTQAASVFAAVGIGLASLVLTPVLYYLPKATLAATIIIAVLSLVDLSILRKTWRFSRSDFAAVVTTITVTLVFGVEIGVACGVGISIGLHLYRTSKPHVAEVGLIEGTEHFRNVKRYHVQTRPEILTLRPDESLFFANASYLEDIIQDAVYQRDRIAHVILQCSAVNEIDYSALEVLEHLNQLLEDQGICFHLSEVKGPVMDNLRASGFLDHLSGSVYVTQYGAFSTLSRQFHGDIGSGEAGVDRILLNTGS